MNNCTLFYYSGTGTAKKIVESIGEELGMGCDSLDLLRFPLQEEMSFTGKHLVVVGMPVYSGRMPPVLGKSLARLRGHNTPAIIAVTYGDRAYDDALIELQDSLEEQGFSVIGAAAFVARHAVFPRYAVGRPDERDQEILKEFTRRCREKLGRPRDIRPGALRLKGNRPYMKPQELPIYPTPGAECVACGACANLCPVKAIPLDNPKSRPDERCLACAACIHACPQQTRKFRSLTYKTLDLLFLALSSLKKSRRKEPEIFL